MISKNSNTAPPHFGHRKLVVILGPHRSGTSLCTAAIESLGATLGISSLYKNEENLKGFFESPELVAINERLLSYLGGVWDNPGFFGQKAIARKRAGEFEAEARDWISELFSDSSFVAAKDPRLCQLLPFWLKVFEDLGIQREEIYFIHVVRDPVEVAFSQSIRAQKNTSFYEFGRLVEEGGALWLSLTVQSLAYAEGYRNLFVAYQKLLEQPRCQLERIAEYLEVSTDEKTVDEFVADFVDHSLHRSRPDQEIRASVSEALPVLHEVYSVLLDACDGGPTEGVPSVEGIFRRSSTQIQFYRAQSGALSRLSRRCREQGLADSRMKDEIQHLRNQVSNLREELDKQVSFYRQELEARRYGVLSRFSGRCREKGVSDLGMKDEIQHLRNQVSSLREELDKQVSLYRQELDSQIANYRAALEGARFALKEREQVECALRGELERIRRSAPPGRDVDHDSQDGNQ